MSWRVHSQPRAQVQEWVRESFFGLDLPPKSAPQRFRERLVETALDASRAFELAVAEIEGLATGVGPAKPHEAMINALREQSSRLDGVRQRLKSRDIEQPFRVVLMGRTMAGKSTLFEYLTGGDGERVGVGGQRTTRTVCVRTVAHLGLEIVDTPGVGAMDGQDDYDTAFSQVADADLILWIATDEATQAQTGEALERLSDLGKPIIVALNCLADTTEKIGLTDMLEKPELIFGGDLEGNLAPIRRHLSRAGGQYIGDAVAIHAQAAQLSISGDLTDEESRTLRENSRIDLLLDALRTQSARTAKLRRIVSICDPLRGELLDAASMLNDAILTTRSMLAASRGSQQEFHKRAGRRIDDAQEEFNTIFVTAVATRERWIEKVDVVQNDRLINHQWNQELAGLRAEIERHGAEIGQRLEVGLKEIAIDVADDWAEVDIDGFRDLGGRGAIWGNRVVKIGGRVAVGSLGAWGGAVAGAKIGALAGTAISPGLGTAIGVSVGVLIGLVVGILPTGRFFDWLADKAFRSPSDVHERRRQKLREQLSPMLDELNEKLELASDRARNAWLTAVDAELERQSTASDAIEQSLAVLIRVSLHQLEPALTQVDTELARELLRNHGRWRAATAVIRATRWRGAGLAVELPEPAFTEMVLFPINDMVERILPTSARAPAQNCALHVIRNLTEHDVTVHTMERSRLSVTLGAPSTPGVREAWASLAQAHTSVRVDINEMVEGDSQ